MTIAEHPHSLEESVVTVSELSQPKTSFEVAHVGEILHDLHEALLERNYDANMFVQQMSSTDVADLAISIPKDVRSKPRSDEAVPITRGFVTYNDKGTMKGIGFDAFPNGSVRTIAGRPNENGGFEWRLPSDLPSEEKVRRTGTWKDAGTGIEIPIFERAGDTVVHMLTDSALEGRSAQSRLRHQINPLLPEGMDLPDYANIYLPTKTVKK